MKMSRPRSGLSTLVLVFTLFMEVGVLVGLGHAQSRSTTLVPMVDPRGPAELTVCSQNLENYGVFRLAKSRSPSLTLAAHGSRGDALVRRFVTAGCDVVAVQEVLGSNLVEARAGLEELAALLRRKTNRFYDVRVGESNDSVLHNGFLIAKDRAEVMNATSYHRVELPKLVEKSRPRTFSRGPYEVQLAVHPRGEEEGRDKVVTLVTFHFKSKRGRPGDPAELDFETFRLEMGEALRRIVESRHARSFASGETLLLLLGDRNAHFDTASAKVLEGVLQIENFQGEAPCRMGSRGVPLCQAESARAQKLFSVLTTDPQTRLYPGTFRYKKIYSWIDDILLPAESLPFAWSEASKEGDYDSGIVYEPREASDHALIYVRLNW